MNIWTIDSEFLNIKYNQTKTSGIYQSYMNKLLKILLLRDLNFFEKYLSNDLYEEFIEKITIYCNNNGNDIKYCSLYFSEYNFSPELTNIILDLRNKYGLYILLMIVFPYESFSNQEKQISMDLKNINKEINLKRLLQEVSFDLGCSSYALGKLYDYHIKIIENNIEVLDDDAFDSINNNIKDIVTNMVNVFKKCKNTLTNDDINIIKDINNHKSNFTPLSYDISNKIILHLIKDQVFL